MFYKLDFDSFLELVVKYDCVFVICCFMCDGLIFVFVFQWFDDGGMICFFESVIGGEKVGCYSFLVVNFVMEIIVFEYMVCELGLDGEFS